MKDTKVLEISVTLPHASQAQALVQYLADETIALDRGLASAGDQEILDRARQQLDTSRKDLDRARGSDCGESVGAGPRQPSAVAGGPEGARRSAAGRGQHASGRKLGP